MRRPRVAGEGSCSRAGVVCLLATAVAIGAGRSSAQSPADVESHLREGRYEDAVAVLEDRWSGSGTAEAGHDLAQILLETGEYERAGAVLLEARGGGSESSRGAVLLGRALESTGRLDEAREAYERAAGLEGDHALLGELHRAEVLARTGHRDDAFDALDRFIDVYNGSAALASEELQAVATAVRHLGVATPALYHDALRAYDEAVAADPSNLEARLGIGELFLDRFSGPDARQAFHEVLELRGGHPRALLGLARVAASEGSPEAVRLVERALASNPRLVPALVLRARMSIAGEELGAAEEDLEAALAIDSTSSEALAVLGSLRFVTGDVEGFERLAAGALSRNPHDGAFFAVAAEQAAQTRLYREAVRLADRGIEADSLSWASYTARGINRMRIGEIGPGRADLEHAFSNDPFNVRVKNTLDLLDVMAGFEEWESERIRLALDPEDGEALATYMLEVAERAYGELAERYGHRPPVPVRVEAFRRSADFSVRTVGLTGLGALGVSFGEVLAMESPAARGIEGFHWASVLWHEMAHSFHLSVTEHRVPRWFTEGLAVREERRAAPGWGRRPSLPFFRAYLDEGVRPPSELSLSFVRPRTPEEIGHAYVLGSLVTEWIEGEWGFGAVQGLLEGFRTGAPAEVVLRDVLGVDGDELDERFDAWFRERFREPLEIVEGGGREMEELLTQARSLLEDGRAEEAVAPLEAARDLFLENADPTGPYPMLARAHLERGSPGPARSTLKAYLALNAGDYEAWLELARLEEESGETRGAAEALEAAVLVHPFDLEVHERLAGLFREVGDAEREVRERRVLVSLAPVDRAGALYRLGEAQLRAGRLDAARRSVVEALELAPRFPEAQDLLLRIVEAGGGGGP